MADASESHDAEHEVHCPLCMEPLDASDRNFFPCPCGYQVCGFCWHKIRLESSGLCPACRQPYDERPAEFKATSSDTVPKTKTERRKGGAHRRQQSAESRKHLSNIRVVQRNLVYVIGLASRMADEEVLRRPECFGQYGKILKIVLNKSSSYSASQEPSCCAYITFQREEDAAACINAVNGANLDGKTLKLSFGTTKYCSQFLRHQPCTNSECMYLHHLADTADSFTKEDMQQGRGGTTEKGSSRWRLATTPKPWSGDEDDQGKEDSQTSPGHPIKSNPTPSSTATSLSACSGPPSASVSALPPTASWASRSKPETESPSTALPTVSTEASSAKFTTTGQQDSPDECTAGSRTVKQKARHKSKPPKGNQPGPSTVTPSTQQAPPPEAPMDTPTLSLAAESAASPTQPADNAFTDVLPQADDQQKGSLAKEAQPSTDVHGAACTPSQNIAQAHDGETQQTPPASSGPGEESQAGYVDVQSSREELAFPTVLPENSTNVPVVSSIVPDTADTLKPTEISGGNVEPTGCISSNLAPSDTKAGPATSSSGAYSPFFTGLWDAPSSTSVVQGLSQPHSQPNSMLEINEPEKVPDWQPATTATGQYGPVGTARKVRSPPGLRQPSHGLGEWSNGETGWNTDHGSMAWDMALCSMGQVSGGNGQCGHWVPGRAPATGLSAMESFSSAYPSSVDHVDRSRFNFDKWGEQSGFQNLGSREFAGPDMEPAGMPPPSARHSPSQSAYGGPSSVPIGSHIRPMCMPKAVGARQSSPSMPPGIGPIGPEAVKPMAMDNTAKVIQNTRLGLSASMATSFGMGENANLLHLCQPLSGQGKAGTGPHPAHIGHVAHMQSAVGQRGHQASLLAQQLGGMHISGSRYAGIGSEAHYEALRESSWRQTGGHPIGHLSRPQGATGYAMHGLPSVTNVVGNRVIGSGERRAGMLGYLQGNGWEGGYHMARQAQQPPGYHTPVQWDQARYVGMNNTETAPWNAPYPGNGAAEQLAGVGMYNIYAVDLAGSYQMSRNDGQRPSMERPTVAPPSGMGFGSMAQGPVGSPIGQLNGGPPDMARDSLSNGHEGAVIS